MTAISFFEGIEMGAAIDGNSGNSQPPARGLSFADAVATRYQSPLDIAHKFHYDAQAAAQAIGVQLPDAIDFSGAWTYASNAETGKDDKRQGYIAEIRQRGDGLIRPVITISTFRGGSSALQWCPDNLLWDEHRDTSAIHQAHDPKKYRAQAAKLAEEHAAKRAEREKNDAVGQSVVAMTAAKVLKVAQDCTQHEYLTSKGVGSHGAKIATQRITGTLYNQLEGKTFEGTACDADDLLIPLYKDGELVSVQRIRPDGSKRFLMGGVTAGACYLIEGTSDAPAFVTEGFATGATVCEATGRSVYVAFSAYNLKAVADANQDIGAVAADANDAGIKGAEATGLPHCAPPDTTGGDDWNDYAQLKGVGVAAEILQYVGMKQRSTEPCAPLEPRQHPLSITVDLKAEVIPPKWIIPHFVAEGIALIAGGHGVGKTTALLPLAMAAAGIHETDYPLAPKHWRHVVYITEDVTQAKLIINGYMRAIGGDYAELVERVHIVEALRMPPSFVVAIGDHYRENYTRTVSTAAGEVKLPPLVVIDTMAATFQLENENDNAEASTLIAALKQQFRLPLWIVGHVSKGDLSKDGLNGSNPSLRGASAFEADANQVLYLTKESDASRWLVRGKSRFESSWHELLIETDSKTYSVKNQFGDMEQLTQRWGIARPQEKTRTEMAKEQQEKMREQANEQQKKAFIDYVHRAEVQGDPINRTALDKLVGGNKQRNTDLINELLDEKWLYEVVIPSEIRRTPSKSQYLVSLNWEEHNEYLATGTPPAHKLEVPDTWKKEKKEEAA